MKSLQVRHSPFLNSACRKFRLVTLLLLPFMASGQMAPSPQLMEEIPRQSLSINPIKPFLGLPNVHFEYQVARGIGLQVASEYLAFDFARLNNHPDWVSRVGANFYPAFPKNEINQQLFVGLNFNYIHFLRDTTQANTFAPGLEFGYKKFIWNRLFIASRLSLIYNPKEDSFLPGLEVLVGFVF